MALNSTTSKSSLRRQTMSDDIWISSYPIVDMSH